MCGGAGLLPLRIERTGAGEAALLGAATPTMGWTHGPAAVQAGRAGAPPWRSSRSLGGSSADGGPDAATGDDNLTARAGEDLSPLQLPVSAWLPGTWHTSAHLRSSHRFIRKWEALSSMHNKALYHIMLEWLY